MLRIDCPWCGVRDETEFRYRGDASLSAPASNACLAEFCAQTYVRENRRGWHLEWWLHVGGCRKLLKVARRTDTHDIHAVSQAQDPLALPMDTVPP